MQDTATKRNCGAKRGDIFSIQRWQIPTQKWCNPYRSNNNQSSYVIGSRSRAGSSVIKCKRGGIFTTNTCQNGPPTTKNPNPNWQLNGGGSNQPQNPTQINKINGHALPSATRPQSPRPILNLLATGKTQHCGLFYKTPLTIAPCQCQVWISVKGQRTSRSKKSETDTRTDPTKISNKQTSYKGVLDLPNTYAPTEATYLAKQAVGN